MPYIGRYRPPPPHTHTPAPPPPWRTFGTLANSADSDQTPQRVCTVCLNYRKLRVKWNGLKSPFRSIFPAYTQRQSTVPVLSVLWLQGEQLLLLPVAFLNIGSLLKIGLLPNCQVTRLSDKQYLNHLAFCSNLYRTVIGPTGFLSGR